MIMSEEVATEFKAAHSNIQDSLKILRNLSTEIDFKSSAQRKIFFDYVVSVKKKYRWMEGILSSKTMPLVRPPAMRLYISKNINPKQMEAWIDKIQITMDSIVQTPEVKLKTIRQQYIYLDIVIKVLNGDAYFVGTQQSLPNAA